MSKYVHYKDISLLHYNFLFELCRILCATDLRAIKLRPTCQLFSAQFRYFYLTSCCIRGLN